MKDHRIPNEMRLFGRAIVVELIERLTLAKEKRADTTSPDILLEVRHITKSFEGKTVVQDVSLQVGRSSRVLFLGDNGSGKSTLFGMLSGYLSADEGDVLQKKDLHFAYVAQEDAAMPFTVTEMADALIRQKAMDKETFFAHARGFGLEEETFNQSIADLSEGQRKKLFLCFALARPTELLILDEPTNHLDVDGVSYLCSLLRPYQGALLTASHSPPTKTCRSRDRTALLYWRKNR